MNGAVEFEKAIILTGYGRFHYELVACCAVCFLAVGFQNGIAAYFLPVAQCDLNLTSAQLGYLNVSFLLGGILSALLWGLLGDILGRRKVLMITLFIDWMITVCASLSQTYFALAFFRFFNGFFIGAPGTLIFSYLAEFHPEHKRSQSICYVGFFFTLSWVLLPVTAWLIIPIPWEIRLFGFVFNSWRLFIMTLSLTSLLGGFSFLYFPESPKFLLARGEKKQALNILRYMFARNNGKLLEEYPVKILLEDPKVSEYPKNMSGPIGRGRTVRLLKDMHKQLQILFNTPLLSSTILTSIMLFTNMYGFYGLGLWIPEIFSRFEEYSILNPDKSVTFCQLQDEMYGNITIGTSVVPLHEIRYGCCNNQMDNIVFINTIVMGICCCTGNVISGYLAGRLDRRVVPVTTMLIGGISASVMFWLNSGNQHLVIASIFQAAMSTSNMALNSVVVDLFPTMVSAMAVCTATLAGRLGAVVSNLTFGLLLDQSCEVPIFVVSVILSVGGLTGLFIPSGKTEEIKIKEEDTKSFDKPVSIPEISIISVD